MARDGESAMSDRRTVLRTAWKAAAPLGLAAAACGPLESARTLLRPDDRERITALADASLAPAAPALKADFEKANPHVLLSVSLLSSGEIMKSVLRGKRFDAVLLAGDTFAVPLVEAGHIQIGSMRPIASNWLVIATAGDSPLELHTARDLLRDDVRRVGIADWEQSSLGAYSRQALESLELWEALASKRSKSKDERELRERLIDGKVDAAFLYSSSGSEPVDSSSETEDGSGGAEDDSGSAEDGSGEAESSIRIQAPVPEQAHRPIIYYAGTARVTRYPVTLSQFSKYLISQWGQRHFEAAGYRMLTLR